jgi:hypothetical protein
MQEVTLYLIQIQLWHWIYLLKSFNNNRDFKIQYNKLSNNLINIHSFISNTYIDYIIELIDISIIS